MSRRLTVAPGEAGTRLDAFLVRQGAAPSAAAARRRLAAGTVRVDGRPGKKGQALAAGQVVELPEEAAPPAVPPDAALPLRVLLEDPALVAIDKPAGMPTHPLHGEGGTCASALLARFPECAVASPDAREAGFVHRLDVGTSGVLVAARSPAAWSELRRRFASDEVLKTYLAEVQAAPAATPDELVIDLPIGRPGRHSPRVTLGRGRGLLPARTEVSIRDRGPSTWLVEARLHRGRAHQVRAHLADLGLPIVGDTLYGAPTAGAPGAGRPTTAPFHLHAWRVRFAHPLTGAELLVEAPPPAWAAGRWPR